MVEKILSESVISQSPKTKNPEAPNPNTNTLPDEVLAVRSYYRELFVLEEFAKSAQVPSGYHRAIGNNSDLAIGPNGLPVYVFSPDTPEEKY